MKTYFKLFLVVLLFVPSFCFAQASVYNATDVIGQNLSDGTPVWTTSTANNKANVSGMDNALNWPDGNMAIDNINHRLFVGDSGNNRVLVFNLNEDGTLVDHNADYVLGQPDFDTVDAGTTKNKLSYPYGLAYDSFHNRLFVADDENYRVIVFDTTTITNGEDAVNVLGQPDFTTNISSLTNDGLSDIYGGLVFDSINNRLFVADSTNNRIMIFDTTTINDGMAAINVLGQPNFGTADANTSKNGLNNPYGLAFDKTNNRLFVSDYFNNRVMVFDVSTIENGEDAINVLGQTTFDTRNNTLTSNGLSEPYELIHDSVNNRLFVGDYGNNRVLIFDTTTITNGMEASYVLGQPNFDTSVSSPTQNEFNYLSGFTYDSNNNYLYVADGVNNRIMIFDTTTITNGMNAVDVIGQNKSDGTPVWTTSEPNNAGNVIGPNAISDPEGSMAVDTVRHRLFVNDADNNRVLVFNLNEDGTLVDHNADYVLGQPDFDTVTPGTTQSKFNFPMAVIYDNNKLFIPDSENNRVLIFDVSTITNGMNASYVLGQPDFISKNSNTTQNGLDWPDGLAYDFINDRLFVSDDSNNRVLVFDTTNITNGMNAINVLGQPDFITSDNSSTTQNRFNAIYTGVVYDSYNNRLFISDYAANRVLIFDVSTITNGMNASYVLGQPDFISSDYNTTQNGLNRVEGLAFDLTNNRLFISDFGNNRVLVFDTTNITNGMNAINVLGQPDFITSDNSTTQNGFNSPESLGLDSVNNRLYVGDFDNNRIMIFDLIKQTSSLPNGTINTPYSQTLETKGSQGTVSYELSNGTLPIGLILTDDTISGTPTVAGTYTFTIKAKDTWTDEPTIQPFTDSKTYTIEIVGNTPVVRHISSGSSSSVLATFQQEQQARAEAVGLPTTVPTTYPTLVRTLKYKMTGEDVKQLQIYLNTHNYLISLTGAGSLNNETTYFGLKTKQAVIKFQLANGLVGDGVVGPMTRGKIK